MAQRRHRGQIIPKGRGSWRLRWYLGIDPTTGRRRYASETVHGSRRDAQRRLQEITGLVENGVTVTTRGTTVAVMLREWLEDDAAQAKRRERTRSDYRALIERHIVPKIGAIRLDRLDPTVIERRLTHPLASAGKVRTAKLCRDVLSAACRWAVRAKRYGIDSNPVRGVEIPNGSSRKVGEALTPEQVTAFRNAIADTPHEPLFLLLLGTGLRPSEALALRWSDLGFEVGTVSVERTLVPRSKLPPDRRAAWPTFTSPKSEAGCRVVPLAPVIVKALRSHRAKQAEAKLRGEPTLVEMERDENEQRADMAAYDLAKPRVDEVRSAYQAELEVEREAVGVQRRTPLPKHVKDRALGRARKKVGVPTRTAQDDSRIVETVERYPELECFAQRTLKMAAEALDDARPKDRRGLRQFAARFERKDAHDLVFRDRRGHAIDLDNLRARHFKPARRRAELPDSTRLYSLRHSAITAAITAGEDVATVAALAGHASTRITLDTYTHPDDAAKRRAAATMAATLLGADS